MKFEDAFKSLFESPNLVMKARKSGQEYRKSTDGWIEKRTLPVRFWRRGFAIDPVELSDEWDVILTTPSPRGGISEDEMPPPLPYAGRKK